MKATSRWIAMALMIAPQVWAGDKTTDAKDDSLWPGGKPWHPHFVGGASFGSCTRYDPDVGASGVCGEAILGLDIPFRLHNASFRFDPELGFGWNMGVTTGDKALGVAIGSGGAGFSMRHLFTVDVTRLFFVRAGPEVRGAMLLDIVNISVHGVLDVGTRVWNVFELGLRGYAGVDGIEKTGSGLSEWSSAFAWGTMMLARFYTL